MLKKLKGNEKGYSLVEMAVGMLLLLIFGTALLTLTASSAGSYERLVNEKAIDTEFRIASSYLTTKLRQNDRSGAVVLISQDTEPGVAIKISEDLSGEIYETWIYVADGFLKEVMIPAGVAFDGDYAFVIAEIDQMELIDDEEGVIGIELFKEGSESQLFWVALMSDR
ncbi:MAG: DUF4860 domain-containing protein [Clostridia bacterium]|nr:DUF4860 domain-containing protein [Clostridia bacterium]